MVGRLSSTAVLGEACEEQDLGQAGPLEVGEVESLVGAARGVVGATLGVGGVRLTDVTVEDVDLATPRGGGAQVLDQCGARPDRVVAGRDPDTHLRPGDRV